MNKLQKKFGKLVQRIIDTAMGNGLMQEETTASGERYVTPGIGELIRQAGAESCVLLKNDGALPLRKDTEIAVFGRCQLDWFYVGYGSGGDVHAPYYVSLIDGLRNAGAKLNADVLNRYYVWTTEEDNKADHGWWGHWPYSHPEMPLDVRFAEEAAKRTDTALIVIGRAAGEDRENTLTKGSYYLTDAERAMLDAVTQRFSKTVVLLNIGSIMDMAWTEEYGDKLSAILIVWQGGMESGNAAADVLYGKVSPCGKLSDTVARRYEDYPSSTNFGGKVFNDYAEGIFVGYRYYDKKEMPVNFPFGHGLSYTSFAYSNLRTDRDVLDDRETVTVSVDVTNTGAVFGKTAVQLYVRDVESTVRRPLRELRDFAKVELQPGETKTVSFTLNKRAFAYYEPKVHDFFVESGEFVLEIGESCRDIRMAKSVQVEGTVQLSFIITETTTIGQLMKHPKGAAFVRQMLGSSNSPSSDQAEAMGEGSERMMQKMMLEMPLGALVSYGRMNAEQLSGLIASLNG